MRTGSVVVISVVAVDSSRVEVCAAM